MNAPEISAHQQTIEYNRDLELRQNAVAVDPESISPWFYKGIFDAHTHNRNLVHYARIAIDARLDTLSTSPADIKDIGSLLTLDKTLRDFVTKE